VRLSILVIATALLACSKETVAVPMKAPDPAPQAGHRAQVEAAFPGALVQGPSLLGASVELYRIVQGERPGAGGLGIAVIDGEILRDSAAFVKLAPRFAGDAPALAQAAAALLPAVGTALPDHPPTVEGGTLRLFAGQGEPMRTDRWLTVDLATGTVQTAPVPAPAGGPVPALLATIAGPNDIDRDAALQLLGRCGDPAAADALLTLAQTHPVAAVRAEATRLAATCPGPQTITTLMALLETPGDGQVRMHAAQGLGALKAQAARDLLQRILASDSDPAAKAGARRGLRALDE